MGEVDNLETLKSLQELIQTCSSPVLKGRNVKIPVTSKAYFEGTLDPSHYSIGKGVLADDHKSVTSKEEETVLVNLGKEYMVELNKAEACDFVEKKISKLRKLVNTSDTSNKKTTTNGGGAKKKDTKLKIKKGFLNSGKKSGSKKKKADIKASLKPAQKANSTRASPSNATASPILPFMEIREEFDKDGNEVKAEALNISNELVNFHRELKEKKEGLKIELKSEKQNEKNEIVDALLNNLPEKNNFEETTEKDTKKEERKLQKQTKNYDQISTRLDQLILLEEEDMKKKAENVKSSKRLRGKGWAKGFLDNSASIKEKPNTRMKAKLESRVERPLDEVKTSLPKTVPNNVERGNKTVQFKSTNEVKEIPRIGNRSVVETIRPSINKTPVQSIQKRETHFIGNIVERDQLRTAVQPRDNNSQQTEPRKKLSKFAQRRLQQRQQR